jgi:hypothetical protein
MAKDKTYKVTLPKAHAYPQYQRAGITVLSGEDGYEGPLTAEQVKTLKADELLTVKEVKGNDKKLDEHTSIEADGQELVPEENAPATEGIAEENPDAPAEAPAEDKK